jgi:hypothetical protein
MIRYSHPVVTVVESWLGSTRLSGAVPLTAGRIDADDSGTLKRRLTVTVPARTPDGKRWDPAGDPTAPLAAYGQRLRVRTGIAYPDGGMELLQMGWYLITEWTRDEEEQTVAVVAADLGLLISDARFHVAQTPPAGATFASEFHRLVGGILPSTVDPALVDRAVAPTVVWDRDRDQALTELCDAWPARWYVDDAGAAHAAPPYPPVTPTTPPDITLTDGLDGTLVTRQRKAQRTAIFNQVVVDGKATDDATPAPHAVVQVTAAGSPILPTGPFGARPQFYASDAITTQAQADEAAAALLVRYASVGRAEQITCVPDASVELGDVARVYTRDGDVFTARVVTLSLPLTAAAGPMALGPSLLPGGDI